MCQKKVSSGTSEISQRIGFIISWRNDCVSLNYTFLQRVSNSKYTKSTHVRCLELTCLLFDFSKQLNTEEELLEFEATQFPILQAMIAYKEPYDKLWRTTLSFHNKNEAWLNGNRVFLYYLMDTRSLKQVAETEVLLCLESV